jgi:hypothetical protein
MMAFCTRMVKGGFRYKPLRHTVLHPIVVWYGLTLSSSTGAKKYLASCAVGGMLRIGCDVGGIEYENCALRAVLCSTYAYPNGLA